MLKLLKSVFGLLAFVLAVYALITGRFIVMPFMIFSLGVMLLVMGLQEKRKPLTYSLILVSGFNLFVSIYTFFMN
ncbi:DUF3953 domain-containing protein [Bacillus sp. AFS055030]|uniref:DUF3953 domain-containing protein n=1 Tax=Bacillus sp. AFS055030 TaxID=2033507 RepID=UPI000BFC4C37|nr:DUF3953 domain-containing protein [Bacillus sp. AFS055030]PGL70895.1 hypothetical protein CN925_10310 [Bacillus sp. AFS055030]